MAQCSFLQAKVVQDLKTGCVTSDFGALAHGAFISVPKRNCAYLVKTQRNSTWNSRTLGYSRVALSHPKNYLFLGFKKTALRI